MTHRNSDRQSEERRRGIAAYQGALEAVLAIVITAGIGYWADQRFGTEPRWLILGTCLGFAAFVLRLFRMRKLFEDPAPGSEERPGSKARPGNKGTDG